ncbi:MAG TPA: transcriptional regulator [Pyrinomonadaceae bacterium]|nr:transcriptional regulator [Pyrinomonadaceae bacterium]
MSLFKEITELDKLLHEPSRLAIMTALAGCKSADFLFLQRLTGMSKGNLSSHLSKLEEAGLVEIQKSFIGKIPNTSVSLTEIGINAINEHWQKLEELRNGAKTWNPENESIETT